MRALDPYAPDSRLAQWLRAALVGCFVVARLGLRLSHLINLFIGGIALISFRFIHDPNWLLLSMAGVGFAWASIVSLPYALLSAHHAVISCDSCSPRA